jgi:hypothetical protein
MMNQLQLAVGGHDDARLLSVAVRGGDGDLRADLWVVKQLI